MLCNASPRNKNKNKNQQKTKLNELVKTIIWFSKKKKNFYL